MANHEGYVENVGITARSVYGVQQGTATSSYCIPATDTLKTLLDKTKGNVVKQFELVCPTDASLKRAKKTMHDIFDELERQLSME